MNRILIVEDEPNILKAIEICMLQAGYEVLIARNGVEAIEKAIDNRPDLILLGLILPKMNGYLVCEALREEDSTKDIPVIIISARAQEEDIKRAKNLGAAEYIIKPFSPDELRNKVKILMKDSREVFS